MKRNSLVTHTFLLAIIIIKKCDAGSNEIGKDPKSVWSSWKYRLDNEINDN